MVDQSNMDAVLDRIVKLLKLAGNNPNSHESASAAAKAQEIMTQYNLDMGSIERKSGAADDKREKEAVEGGFYKYNRDLYAAVAALNFCMHWIGEGMVPFDKENATNAQMRDWRNAGKPENFKTLRKIHQLIGRRVNVAATKVMASYLEQAVERILREEMEAYNYGSNMLYSKWAMSFREGAVANLVERIQEERDRAEEERAKKAKAEKTRAAHPSAAPSTSTALTLTDYTKSEEIGNYDARYGEGAWARKLANDAKWMAEYKAESERYNLDLRMDKEGMECLEIFHPKLFAKIKEAERREHEKNEARWERESRRSRSGPREKSVDYRAYEAGRERANEISLNQQIGSETRKRIK